MAKSFTTVGTWVFLLAITSPTIFAQAVGDPATDKSFASKWNLTTPPDSLSEAWSDPATKVVLIDWFGVY
ncbi:MAG: hypothetical protein IPK87_08220 [Planctomycetes bacterium]|nr:hypothetical protein [Planctomycetota bacterium]